MSPWKNHKEEGDSVRSIREWDWIKSKDRKDGGKEILYGNHGGDKNNQKQHGHYGEDGSGNPDSRNRPPKE